MTSQISQDIKRNARSKPKRVARFQVSTLFLAALLSCLMVSGIGTTDVKSYLSFDANETSGTQYYDRSGNLYNGTHYGTGKKNGTLAINESISVDGASDGVNMSTLPISYFDSSANFSLCLWFNFTSLNGATSDGVIGTLDTGNNGFGMFPQSDVNLTMFTGAAFVLPVRAIAKNEYFFCFVRKADDWYAAYVNGTLRRNVTDSWTDSTAKLVIGNMYSGNSLSEGMTGGLDEFSFFNDILTDSEISDLWNSGAGIQYPFSTPHNIFVNMTAPANASHDIRINTTFYVNSTSVPSADCTLYVNDTANATTTATVNQVWTLGTEAAEGNHTIYLNCTTGSAFNVSASVLVVVDKSAPVIDLLFPSLLNTTTYDLSFNLTGNVTDMYLYRVNVSIINTSGGYQYENFTDNITSGFLDFTQQMNSTLWVAGTYHLRIDASDSHTANTLPPSFILQSDKEDVLYFENKAIVTFNHSEYDDFAFNTLSDRITWDISAKEGFNGFSLYSEHQFKPISNSPYTCHYVFGDYWVDAEGLEKPVCRLSDDGHVLNIDYVQNAEKVQARSIGGLNMVFVEADFQVAHCVPLWTCSAYGACNATTLTQSCLAVTDAMGCGTPFTGNLSAYDTACGATATTTTSTSHILEMGLLIAFACFVLFLGIRIASPIMVLFSGIMFLGIAGYWDDAVYIVRMGIAFFGAIIAIYTFYMQDRF